MKSRLARAHTTFDGGRHAGGSTTEERAVLDEWASAGMKDGMGRDAVVTVTLVLAFALLVTAHVTLLVGLAGRAPRWRALVALIVPPLAPYWGWRPLRIRSVAWLAGALMYGVLLLVAQR
jgi:hypothetical protein